AVGRPAAARGRRAGGRLAALADPRRRAHRQPRLAARRGGHEAARRAQREWHDDHHGHALRGARRVRAPDDPPVRRVRRHREPAGGELIMLRNYLAVALRNLAANKVNAAINIGGLAVGLAACLVIVLFVRDELSYERWLPGVDRIASIESTFLIPGRD